MRTRMIAVALALVAATPALAGPPWISIELPANPYDAASRSAFLLVHTYHHGTPVGMPLTGTAEGVVNGQRRSVPLTFDATSRSGVYALRNQWGSSGVWTLVIVLKQGEHAMDRAQALVEIAANGSVTGVSVPTNRRQGHVIPSPASMREIEASLRARAAD
jgi:hypothetical protein